jgi:hypothetical protein
MVDDSVVVIGYRQVFTLCFCLGLCAFLVTDVSLVLAACNIVSGREDI